MRGIKTKKEQVYDYIKDEIISGNFKPGEWIQEKIIANKLNVSRSPVRESLKELSVEGFTKNIPNKGVYVREIKIDDIIDFYEMRVIIEKYSIKRIIKNIKKDKNKKIITDKLNRLEQRFNELYKEEEIHNYTKLDNEFHTTLVKLSDNKLAVEIFDKPLQKIQIFQIIPLASDQNRFNESYQEHIKIIDGIKAGDFEKSWKWDSKNILLSFKNTMKVIEKMYNYDISKVPEIMI